MSAKRRPGTELNHENWDEEDDIEESGEFKKAPEDELKRRIIKKAVRRSRGGPFGGNGDDSADGTATADAKPPSGSVFSGFGGFGSITTKSINSPFSLLSSSSAPVPVTTASSTLSAKGILNGNASTSTTVASTSTGSFGLKSVTSTIDEKSTNYYAQLKGLNQSVSAWITKHVDSNPLCILTPIFDEYKKFLNEIDQTKENDTNSKITSSTTTTNNTNFNFTSSISSTSKPATNAAAASTTTATTTQSIGTFSFGTSIAKDSSTINKNEPVKLGASVFEPTAGPSKPLAFGGPAAAAFSFGGSSSTPFTFANVRKPDEHPPASAGGGSSAADDENEEPPKNEFVPVVEEDSLYSKRCKVFVKGSGGYVDRGVGMAYIKSADNGNKTQMIVRADTNLGNVLLNILLTDAVPANRMGKNNVMLICLPTPDSKPPPSTVLIRVKDSDEADELLEQINKHKK